MTGEKIGGKKEQILAHLMQQIDEIDLTDQNREAFESFNWEEHLELYLQYFQQAYSVSKPMLFSEFLSWEENYQYSRNISEDTFQKINALFKNQLKEQVDQAESDEILDFFERGLKHSKQIESASDSYLHEDNELGSLAIEYLDALLNGDRRKAAKLITDSVEEGISVKDIYLHVFQPCQYEIGRLWQMNRISVAQEHFSTAATQMIMSQLYPRIFSTEKTGKSLVASAIGGELHEIGIRMVTDFFEMEGWDTFYLGANCPAEDIIQELITRDADMLALSVTISHHIDTARALINKVRNSDRVSDITVMVGGRVFAVDEELWNDIGADVYAQDAEEAIEIANKFVQE